MLPNKYIFPLSTLDRRVRDNKRFQHSIQRNPKKQKEYYKEAFPKLRFSGKNLNMMDLFDNPLVVAD
jgi:hypothetical protein